MVMESFDYLSRWLVSVPEKNGRFVVFGIAPALSTVTREVRIGATF